MSYIGMNSKTGRTINDMDHINQSIKDILTTPIVRELSVVVMVRYCFYF